MSSESENQNITPPVTDVLAPTQENITVICDICEATINDDETKLTCVRIRNAAK